jgi:hypothetical protein
MNDNISNWEFKGNIFTDITSFSLTQNLFDGKNNINLIDIESFDSTIQLLLFYEKIHVVEPITYCTFLDVEIPEILNELTQKQIVQKIPHEKYKLWDLISHYNDIEQMTSPDTIKKFSENNPDIISDLLHYQNNFKFVQDERVHHMARNFGLDLKLIPLVVNLFRMGSTISHLKNMESEKNELIAYSPTIIRNSLAETLIKYKKLRYENQSCVYLNNILKKMQESQSSEMKERNYAIPKKYNKCEFDMPILSNWILNNCNKKSDVFDKIIEIRNDGQVRKLRKFTKKLQMDLTKLDYEYDKDIEDKYFDIYNDIKNTYDQPFSIKGSIHTFINDAPITVQKALQFFGHKLTDIYFRRQLYFLFEIKKQSKKVTHSKEEFKRIFKVDIKDDIS